MWKAMTVITSKDTLLFSKNIIRLGRNILRFYKYSILLYCTIRFSKISILIANIYVYLSTIITIYHLLIKILFNAKK